MSAKRSTSKTFLSNEVFQGDTSFTPKERFMTSAKVVQEDQANKYSGMSAERYGKGCKP